MGLTEGVPVPVLDGVVVGVPELDAEGVPVLDGVFVEVALLDGDGVPVVRPRITYVAPSHGPPDGAACALYRGAPNTMSPKLSPSISPPTQSDEPSWLSAGPVTAKPRVPSTPTLASGNVLGHATPAPRP